MRPRWESRGERRGLPRGLSSERRAQVAAEDVGARARDGRAAERILGVVELDHVDAGADLESRHEADDPPRRRLDAVGEVSAEREAREGRELAVSGPVLALRSERGIAARVVVAPERGAGLSVVAAAGRD